MAEFRVGPCRHALLIAETDVSASSSGKMKKRKLENRLICRIGNKNIENVTINI